MKLNDTANIMNDRGGYWKGKVVLITSSYSGLPIEPPVITIKEVNGPRHSVSYDKDFEFKQGEYWEVRL